MSNITYEDKQPAVDPENPQPNEKFTAADANQIKVAVNSKQDSLVSGSNIKTLNGASILGSGNIEISGGPGSKGDPGVSFIVGEGTPTERFDSYEDGVTGTIDGELFGVPSANEKVITIYKNVGGFGVYQRVMPWIGIPDIDLKNKSIYYGMLGEMPFGAIIDFDTSQVLEATHKFRNLATKDNPDERFLGSRDILLISSQGVTVLNDAPTTGDANNGFRVAFPETSTTGDQPPFMHINPGIKVPTGQWTIAYDVRLPDGAADAVVVFNDNWNGYWPQTKTLTDEWQTISHTFVSDSDALNLGYPLAMATAAATPSPALEVYVCNLRIVAGAVPLDLPAVQSDILAMKDRPKAYAFTDGMFLAQDGNYRGFRVDTPNPILYKEASVAITFKLTGYGSTNYAMFFGVNEDGEGTNGFIGLASGSLQCQGGLFGNLSSGRKMPLNQWITMVVTSNSTKAVAYINGIEVSNTDEHTVAQNIYTYRLFNYNGGSFEFPGAVSGVTIWNRALGVKEIATVTDIMNRRLAVKGGTVSDIRNVYLAMGDSLTALDHYVKPTQSAFDPYLFGFNFGASGYGLGTPAKEPNTTFSQLDYILPVIKNNVEGGRNVIVSVLIGANGISGYNTPEAAQAFYDNLLILFKILKDAGAKVIAATVTDNGNISDKTAWGLVNPLILSDPTKYDAVVDYYADPRLTPATLEYYSDLQHENEAGGLVMSELLIPVVQSLMV